MTLRRSIKRGRYGVAVLLPLALGVVMSGCWMAALELAPMGLHAVSAVGEGAMGAAANSHGSHDLKPGEDEAEWRERCDDLQQSPPGVIELRTRTASDREWRGLRIEESSGEPRWAPDTGEQAEWRPAEHLLVMSFSPPLALSDKPGASNYLAYAPAEPRDTNEQDQLTGLNIDFGAAAGTFHWQGRSYEYATVTRLPCFPIAAALK